MDRVGRSKVSWVGREEVPAAVAILLSAEHDFFGRFLITGSSSLNLSEAADILAGFFGKLHRYEQEGLVDAYRWRRALGLQNGK
jgi:hypothetical protein